MFFNFGRKALGNMQNKLIIYGAYGYSAKLILENLAKKEIKPMLAGRDEYKLRKVSNQFDCDFVVFDLENEDIIKKNLEYYHTLLNCAGPFKFTAEKFINACLETQTNYLDITGEIPVLEKAWEYNEQAKEKGITILPAVGFDVIPTDCLAAKLKEQMPDAVSLKLGFEGIRAKMSRGTNLTTLEMINDSGKIRKDGKIIQIDIGESTYEIKNDKFEFQGVAIPWGDVSTAYHSTGIPNIAVYFGLPKIAFVSRRLMTVGKDLLGINFIKDFLKKQISERVSGPSEYERQKASMIVWGEVENAKGEKHFEAYRFIEGYELTGRGAAEAVIKVINNEVRSGTQTPSLAFGYSFMEQFMIEKIIEMKIN